MCSTRSSYCWEASLDCSSKVTCSSGCEAFQRSMSCLTTPVSVVSLPSTYVIGPRPSRFSLVGLPPLSLEQAVAKVAVSSAADAATIAARGTTDERRDDTFFQAIADTLQKINDVCGLRRERQHTEAGATRKIHGALCPRPIMLGIRAARGPGARAPGAVGARG